MFSFSIIYNFPILIKCTFILLRILLVKILSNIDINYDGAYYPYIVSSKHDSKTSNK